ncbi:hypothetical protein PISMIDRAFT_20033 [Pisolithus microcarpus 441]|uniref:Uncharacterized protein n=1 Tax=Pisolithus microcarpus 441 TaxID=765257 RepID=A0A0C9Y9V6_9AGAM|nr:hypothetical protein PISMIDRAFT_20033 [Pisolithus microcarpus 441]
MLGGDYHYGCGDILDFVDEGAFRHFREYLITEGACSFGFFSYIVPTLPFTGSSMMSRAAIVLRHLRLLPPPVGAFELVLLAIEAPLEEFLPQISAHPQSLFNLFLHLEPTARGFCLSLVPPLSSYSVSFLQF